MSVVVSRVKGPGMGIGPLGESIASKTGRSGAVKPSNDDSGEDDSKEEDGEDALHGSEDISSASPSVGLAPAAAGSNGIARFSKIDSGHIVRNRPTHRIQCSRSALFQCRVSAETHR